MRKPPSLAPPVSEPLIPGMETVPDALAGIAKRFTQALGSYGAIPSGVGWSSPQAQALRFQALLGLLDTHPPHLPYTAFDLGCGYGALWPILDALPEQPIRRYWGYDISAAMIEAATRHYGDDPRVCFVRGAMPTAPADYGFVSGTFNYRGAATSDDWRRYLRATVAHLISQTRRGLAVNFLTWPDAKATLEAVPVSGRSIRRRSPEMFYTTPEEWIGFIERRPSVTRVRLVTGYLDDDFTLLIETA